MPEKRDQATSRPLLVITTPELRRRIDDFIREYLREKSPATVGTYRRSLNEFERWFAQRQDRVRFSVADIAEYKEYLTETRGLHQVSVSTYLTALRRLCQYLADIGVLEENPAAKVKGNSRPTTHSRAVLSQAEIEALTGVATPGSVIERRDRSMIFMMLYAGLSEIELVRADVGDLEQTLMGWFLRVQGKGRSVKDQQVPLDAEVITAVQDYLDSRGRIRPEDPLLVSHGHRSDGERLNTRSIRTRIRRYLDEAGITRPGISPHSLTHTAALIWLNGGMELEEVRRRMRHGTLETTMIYFRRQGLLSRKEA
jgi:site-specific recombinase XerD